MGRKAEFTDKALQAAEGNIQLMSNQKKEREETLTRVTAALAAAADTISKRKDMYENAQKVEAQKKQELEKATQGASAAVERADELTRIKENLEEASHESYVPLKEGQVDDEAQRQEHVEKFKTACNEAGMDEAIVAAAAETLVKDPDTAFSTFEYTGLDDFEEAYFALVQELTESIDEAEKAADVTQITEAHEKAVAYSKQCHQGCNSAQD